MYQHVRQEDGENFSPHCQSPPCSHVSWADFSWTGRPRDKDNSISPETQQLDSFCSEVIVAQPLWPFLIEKAAIQPTAVATTLLSDFSFQNLLSSHQESHVLVDGHPRISPEIWGQQL